MEIVVEVVAAGTQRGQMDDIVSPGEIAFSRLSLKLSNSIVSLLALMTLIVKGLPGRHGELERFELMVFEPDFGRVLGPSRSGKQGQDEGCAEGGAQQG